MNNKPLVVICGPTCTGKTFLAYNLCQKFNGEIVSADSRQIYKGMDIGTGKHTLEKGNVKTHLQDIRNPDELLTAWEYLNLARATIEEIWNKDKLPFLVGGTGFYIDLVLGDKQVSSVPANPKLRKGLEKLPIQELFTKLVGLDPERAKNIDKHNPRRLVRAIEVALNRKESSIRLHKAQFGFCLKIGLTAPRDLLYERADSWVNAIVFDGLLEEVKTLRRLGYSNFDPLKGFIYKEVGEFLDKVLKKNEMVEKIKFAMHSYIRRQLTWFRKDKKIHWLDISEPGFDKEAENLVSSYIDG